MADAEKAELVALRKEVEQLRLLLDLAEAIATRNQIRAAAVSMVHEREVSALLASWDSQGQGKAWLARYRSAMNLAALEGKAIA